MCSKNNEPPLEKADKCRKWHQKRIETRSKDAAKYGVPLFFSEFGACLDTKACVQEITSVADISDSHLVGWAYWQLKTYQDLTTSAGSASEGFYNKDGSLQNQKVKALARTYMLATQGVPKSMNFETSNAEFTSVFTVNTSIKEPTVIYYSTEYWYPHGFDLIVSDATKNLIPETDYTLDQTKDNYLQIIVTN